MIKPIEVIDRRTGKIEQEEVYFGEVIELLYGNSWASRSFGRVLTYLFCHFPFISAFFGWWNQLPLTKKKIDPFIRRYKLDTSEFLEPVESFPSFNDFFIRKLKAESRPVASRKKMAIIPADGRYLFYPNIAQSDGFIVKGEKFHLADLVRCESLAQKYEQGTLVIARLCPTDYHRYHFPVDCIPGITKQINGYLYSVNPIALKKDIQILTKNKRTLCQLNSEEFGDVTFIEVGATNVGSINQTYVSRKPYQKGEEKGYFSFGASTILILFEPNRIKIDPDLLAASSKKIEMRCLMGQQLGGVHE